MKESENVHRLMKGLTASREMTQRERGEVEEVETTTEPTRQSSGLSQLHFSAFKIKKDDYESESALEKTNLKLLKPMVLGCKM